MRVGWSEWWRGERPGGELSGATGSAGRHGLQGAPLPHGHGGPAPRIPLPRRTRIVTVTALALVGLMTIVGLIGLWPDYERVAEISERADYAVPGAIFAQGEVLSVEEECETPGGEAAAPQSGPGSFVQGKCLQMLIGLTSGPDEGRTVELQVRGGLTNAGLREGDPVEVSGYPATDIGTDVGVPGAEDPEAAAETPPGTPQGEPGAAEESPAALSYTYTLSGVERNIPLIVLTLLFVAVVIAVGRLRGLFALVALGISAGVLLVFVLPALVAGGPGLLIGIVGSVAIMFVTLFFVHGLNGRTTAALIGTLCGILIISGISLVSVSVTRLSGVGDEAAGLLSAMVSEIDFRGLLTCSILIAGLGVLNDVTITQASAVWELRAAAPEMQRREVYHRAMRIGRDHIASTVYTVFFAYVGAAISVLILLYLYDRPALSLLTSEDLVTEIVRTLCGSIGLIAAVPITTWVATRFIPEGNEGHEPWRASVGAGGGVGAASLADREHASVATDEIAPQADGTGAKT